MKRFQTLLLVFLFILGFLVRLYRFDGPIADWHAFRQSDTNAVSTIYARDGINLLYPRFFDISNLQSGIYDNPKGFRFVEFPIYNALQVITFKLLFPLGLSLVESGRLISIFATLLGAYFVYLLTKKYASDIAGFFAAAFYLFIPFSIYYGRTVLPDPAMTAAILGGIYFFDLWLDENSKLKTQKSKLQLKTLKFYVLSIMLTSLAFLLKPFALFFILPMIYLAYKKFGSMFIKKKELWLFTVLSITPLVAWRLWIGQHPEGIPSSGWLFNGDGIRFRPAFFRWILYERITKLIFGYAGVLFLSVGTWHILKSKNAGFFLSFLLSSILYVSTVATGNVRHDYYQIAIIPTLSLFGGLGIWAVYNFLKKSSKVLAIGICAILLISSLFFSWKQVRDYFNINDPKMVEAGRAANKILPAEAAVIASHDGSTTMLNLIERQGWPLFERSLPELIKMGADYIVLADPKESDIHGFAKNYETVASTSSYLILKLTK